MEYFLSFVVILGIAGFIAYRALKGEGGIFNFTITKKSPPKTAEKIPMCICAHPTHMPAECPYCFHGDL